MRSRRLLSVICCLAMLITLLPSIALAADPEIDTSTYDFTSDDVAYKKVSDSTVEVAVYQKKGGEDGVTFMGSVYDGKMISIPATVTDNDTTYTVVGIGTGAFATSNPASVTLAEGITYLGENSFTACNTTSLNIPASVKKIGNNAFYDSKFSSITFSEDSQLEEIGDGAFSSCTNLTSLTLPSSVKKIGGAVFASCTNLSSITIPASVTDLDPSVFGATGSSLKEPYYGNGHTITFAAGSKYKIQDGILYDDESLLNVYEVQSSVSVPEGIKYIGDRAFWNAAELTSITFPSTLVGIGNSAFNGTGLTSVTVPSSVTSLGEAAFMNCTSLTTATVNASIDVLPNYTFSCCSSLASVTLPSGLTSIGNYAFGRQSGTSISTSLTSIDIPASVTSIGTGAFRYCTLLESIDLPSGLTSLGESAFQNTGLTSIVIPEGVTTIPKGAFSLVTSLKTVILTGDVTSVGMNAFSGWKSSASGCTLVIANGTAPSFDANAFGVVSSGVTPDGLTVITASDAVSSCKQIAQFSDDTKVTVSGFGLTATTIPTLKVASAEETEPTGNTTTLTADVPTGCTLTVEVADPNIATAAVGADGKTITVTSVGAGETNITVKITLNNPSYILLEKTLDVIVVAADKEPAVVVPAAETPTAADGVDITTEGSIGKQVADALDPANAGEGETTGIQVADSDDNNALLTAAADAKLVQENTVSAEQGEQALKCAGVTVNDEDTVSIVIQPYLDVTILAVEQDSENSTLKLEITPMYRTVATIADVGNGAEIILEDAADGSNSANAVVVEQGKELSVTGATTISIPLPENFMGDTAYIKHTKGSRTYVYTGSVENNVLSFENPHGFSTFEITSENPIVATITSGGVTTSYASLQDAVDEVTDGGTIQIWKSDSATVSRTVSFTVTTADGAETGATATITGGTRTTVTGPDENGKYICVYSADGGSGGSGGGTTTYSISTPSNVENGSISASTKSASKGTTVTITVTPNEGYELDKLTVTDASGNAVSLTDKGDGKYTFTMPASAVEVEVFFQEIVVEPVNPFTDVSTSNYYYEAVLWAVENGVTNGTSATTFSPSVAVSRAQMVTFLWRAHGSPKATGENPFTDVSESAYYYDAVLWAVENGVTVGTSDTTFSPEAPVTRAQAVTFQWRAAGSPAVSGVSFDDVDTNAYYASAVIWAVANGVTNGTGGNNFSPDAAVSRAQAVTFLWRELA